MKQEFTRQVRSTPVPSHWAIFRGGSEQTLIKKGKEGTSLVAQWIRLCAPSAAGLGLIPGQGTRSHMHAATKSSHARTKEPGSHN